MRGRPRKPYDQLQNRRGDRRRVVLDMGGGVTWTVPVNSLAALTATTQPTLRLGAGETLSAKSRIARRKPRDERGRFVRTDDANTEPPIPKRR